jgi:transcriptional regulator with XRE-family HTH domain
VRSARFPEHTHTRYCLRVDKDRPEFGRYLTEAIIESGYETPTHFARDAGIDPGTVSRWIRNLERPSVRLLERAAPKLRRDVREMVAVAYPEGTDESAAPVDRPASHPLALELARMLAESSPLTDEQRERLVIVVDHSMDPYRRRMKRRRTSGPAA